MNEQTEFVDEIVMTEDQMRERIDWLESRLVTTMNERDKARTELYESTRANRALVNKSGDHIQTLQFILRVLDIEGEYMTHAQRNGIMKLIGVAIHKAGVYKNAADNLNDIPF